MIFSKNKLNVRVIVPLKSAFIKLETEFLTPKTFFNRKFQWNINLFVYTCTHTVIQKDDTFLLVYNNY